MIPSIKMILPQLDFLGGGRWPAVHLLLRWSVWAWPWRRWRLNLHRSATLGTEAVESFDGTTAGITDHVFSPEAKSDQKQQEAPKHSLVSIS